MAKFQEQLKEKAKELHLKEKAIYREKCPISPKMDGTQIFFSQSKISRLICKRRINTKDRLMKFGLITDPRCPLCMRENEDINHLFFKCTVSDNLLEYACTMLQMEKPSGNVLEVLTFVMKNFAGPAMRNLASRASFNIVAYSLWKERNARIFRNNTKTFQQLTKEVKNDIYIMLSKINKMKKTRKNILWAEQMGIDPHFQAKKPPSVFLDEGL
uniref:Reverse transcriptase zinc-binding domain-containing protein n=1 Tax=Kalanchoe fedtschenkoi TaxID=63787 RepID=A0A7N0VGA5_KALFE